MTELSYSSYLQVETLLALQKTQVPETTGRDVVLAEHFFIIAHQSCELWLKQAVADLELVRELLFSPHHPADGAEAGLEVLHRVHECLRMLHDQVLVLEHLPLRHFVHFRPYLGTASGAQSVQFRELGRLLDEDGGVYQAFVRAAAHQGCTVAEVCRLGTACGVLHRVAEALLDVGNGYWRWKVAHLGLMSKMVGGQRGTAGTSGEEFLMRRTKLPFPELRRLRGALHTEELAASSL